MKPSKPLVLSRFFVYLFLVALTLLCIGAPWICPRFAALRGAPLSGKVPLLLLSIYSVAIPTAAALLRMLELLRRLENDHVFVAQNVHTLHGLSLDCLLIGLICAASGLYYPTFLMIAAAALFISLILRVVRCVFSQAIAIKEENDFTI